MWLARAATTGWSVSPLVKEEVTTFSRVTCTEQANMSDCFVQLVIFWLWLVLLSDVDALRPAPDEFIIGGKDASIKDFPYHAYLTTMMNTSDLLSHTFCGSAIIGIRWALTVAHCLYPGPNEPELSAAKLRVGLNNLHDEGEVYDIAAYYLHEEFLTMNYDIALIMLDRNIWFNEKVKAVALPFRPENVHERDAVFVTGYGYYEQDNLFDTASFKLRASKMPIRNITVCGMKLAVDRPDRFFCAGDNESIADGGDSGGPAVIEIKGVRTLVGLVQGGKYRKYCLFMRVSGFFDWIGRARSYLAQMYSEL